jgi:hypothetical protein
MAAGRGACGTMTAMSATHAPRPAISWSAWFVGFVAGSLVNVAGLTAFHAGWGLWGYWVLLQVGVMVGAAAWFARRFRWFGVGLVTGCVAEFVILLVLVFTWGTLAGSAVQ